jgi:hypothetical protein
MFAVMAKQKISALIHLRSQSDAAQLGRALETLRPCDEVLLIDHGSGDATEKVAREYGATLKAAIAGVDDGAYAIDCRYRWILCLLPNESLSEALEAALFDWKDSEPPETELGYTFAVRENTDHGWQQRGRELRLVNRDRLNWTEALPRLAPNAGQLSGDLLRFSDSQRN